MQTGTKLLQQASFWLLAMTAAGCATTSSSDGVRFRRHNLATDCYSASSMTVTYGGRSYIACHSRPGREKRADDDKRLPSPIIDFRAFEGPLKVEWVSQDGIKYEHTVRLEEIFEGRIVPHKEDPARIDRDMPLIPENPTIVVEVNDKTLSVLMDAHVALRPSDPAARLRDVRRNRTLAYTRSF